jgi:hypothetical protein
MDGHDLAHYGISAGLAIALLFSVQDERTHINSAISHVAPTKHSRMAWEPLTQDKTIALGEELKKSYRDLHVVLYCSNANCAELRTDFDDAIQIAGWAHTDFEDQFVDSEADVGLFVGPPSKAATDVANAIFKTTGINADIVDIDTLKAPPGLAVDTQLGVGIIFGKKP